MSEAAEHRSLAQVFAQHAGQWVAVDWTTNEVRAVSKSLPELVKVVRRRRLTNVAVVRAPQPDEPELVGLG